MPKPSPELAALAEAVPQLQRMIEAQAGLQAGFHTVGAITDALAGLISVEPNAFARSWFRWRQPNGTIPTLEMLQDLVGAARALNWLPRPDFSDAQAYRQLESIDRGSTGPEIPRRRFFGADPSAVASDAPTAGDLPVDVRELLAYLDHELDKKRSATIEPLIRQFVEGVFDELTALDLQARTAAGRAKKARKAINKEEMASTGSIEGIRHESTFVVSLPLVMRAVSQAFVDLIERDFPDWQARPAGLDPAGLAYVDAVAGEPFRALAEAATLEQMTWEAFLEEQGQAPIGGAGGEQAPLGSRMKREGKRKSEAERGKSDA